ATTEIYTLSLHDALPISDVSAERVDAETGAGVLRDGQPHRSRVRLEPVATRGLDTTYIYDVATDCFRSDVARSDVVKPDGAAHGIRLDVARDTLGAQIPADGFGAQISVHVGRVRGARDRFHADVSRT